MSYLPPTLLAYFLNAVSVSVDKFLLLKSVPNPLLYVFYISLISLIALMLLPFTKLPSSQVFYLASASTILWTAGAYFMFKALQVGQVQRVIPVIGTLIPLSLLIYAQRTQTVTINETWAAGILILGLIIITQESWLGKIKKDEVIFEVLSALLFATSYLALKEAYLKQDFLTVLVYSRMILLPMGAILLLIPKFKRQVFTLRSKISLKSPSSLLFIFGQSAGGLSQLLLTFSISLASPALVNSLQGTQYAFLFILSFVLSKKLPTVFGEKTYPWVSITRMVGLVFLLFGLYILASQQAPKTEAKLGVTYSPRYAYELNLNPRTTFIKILDDLKVKRVRIPLYWDEVETFPKTFNFGTLDYYLSEAQKRQVEVVLVLGYKQPRWPECFAPPWIWKIMRPDREARLLQFMQASVEHFRNYPNLILWQLENEPLFGYGICPPIDGSTREILKKEVGIVKSLDSRPIMLTDSGEMGFWFETLKVSDVFGTTLYRQVWSPYFGNQDYPIPPFFYTLKDQIVRSITGKKGETLISELQAEPWITAGQPPVQTDISQQVKILPVSKLKNNISYAKETGFSDIYLWGVEWWYFMAKNGHPEYLEYGKTVFKE